MSFYSKLGHGTCEIWYITCACTQFISTLDKPWTPDVTPHKQACYQPVKDCTYWHVLCYFNNCDIIYLQNKATSSEYTDKINQLLLEVISDNMAALVQTGQHGAINTTYITTMGYYVIKLLPESFTLQEDTTCDGQISTYVELFSKAHYINCMQYNKNCYW